MGSLIGILSTVILVSTVCTLIFAVGAYVVARGNRDGVNELVTDGELPGEDALEDQFPHGGEQSSVAGGQLFKRANPTVGAPVPQPDKTDDEYLWK